MDIKAEIKKVFEENIGKGWTQPEMETHYLMTIDYINEAICECKDTKEYREYYEELLKNAFED